MQSSEENPPVTLLLCIAEFLSTRVKRLNFTGYIFACTSRQISWSAKMWLLCVSNKAYTRVSKEEVLGDKIRP